MNSASDWKRETPSVSRSLHPEPDLALRSGNPVADQTEVHELTITDQSVQALQSGKTTVAKSLHNSVIQEPESALISSNAVANKTNVHEVNIADQSAITLKSGKATSEHLFPEANSSKKS
jgi:hypothetical protein